MHSLSDSIKRDLESYRARINQHLQKFFKHVSENDVVQAAEKAGGIVSGFADIYSLIFHGTEVKSNRRKREMLVEFLNEVKEHDLEIRELLTKEYRGHVETLVGSLADLHSFFFGGASIKDEDVKRYLEHASKILPILHQYSHILYEYYLEQSAITT